MAPQKPREAMPWLVRATTGGRPTSRKRMVYSLVMMLALVVLAVAIWLSDPELAWYQFLVVVGLAVVAGQWMAIRWIDRNGTWLPEDESRR